jgi:hypothetical protein
MYTRDDKIIVTAKYGSDYMNIEAYQTTIIAEYYACPRLLR